MEVAVASLKRDLHGKIEKFDECQKHGSTCKRTTTIRYLHFGYFCNKKCSHLNRNRSHGLEN